MKLIEGKPLETSWQIHYPGMNYMGPGTHIIQNVIDNVQPTNRVDAVTRQHDIDYLRFAGDNPLYADSVAIANSGYTIPGVVAKLGLGAKAVLNQMTGIYYHNAPLPGYTLAETRRVGELLHEIIHEND